MYIAQCFYVAIQTGDLSELNAKEQAALFRFLGSALKNGEKNMSRDEGVFWTTLFLFVVYLILGLLGYTY